MSRTSSTATTLAIRVAIALVLLLARTAVSSAATTAPPRPAGDSVATSSARDPLARDFPDPFVLRSGRGFLAFATGASGAHIQVARSDDLSSWSPVSDALPRLPGWADATPGFSWAPSVLARGDRFVLYYTARHAASGFQCISRARSDVAEGPYVDDSNAPLVCQVDAPSLCGSIDPTPFVDDDGRAYLLWKSDENSAACRTAPRLWAQALREDGLALEGSAHVLLTKDRPWEGGVIEGPSMVRRRTGYTLFYSANDYESAAYAVGYATCVGPLGPCTKKTNDAPWLASRPRELGPGGQEFFRTGSGATWMAYHAWTGSPTTYAAGGRRTLRFGRVTFDGEAPRLDRAAPSR